MVIMMTMVIMVVIMMTMVIMLLIMMNMVMRKVHENLFSGQKCVSCSTTRCITSPVRQVAPRT